MYTKVIFFIVALTSVTAQNHHHQGDEHGHAYSSQSFVLHQSHAHAPTHHEDHQQGQQGGLYYGHREESSHGNHGLSHFGHSEEYHHEHRDEQHGHHELSHQVQHEAIHQAHHEERQGNHEEHHGHGVSSQSILLHNDGPATKHIEYYGHPKYEFAYEVKDPHTHDQKYQHESRDGDLVKGVYSLHQPDGTVRVVKYNADKKSGFNADVKYEGHAVHVVPERHHHHH